MRRYGLTVLDSLFRMAICLMAGAIIFTCSTEQQAKTESKTATSQSMPRPWAIIYAFAPEGLELKAVSSIVKDTVWAGHPLAVGWLVKPIVIVASGMGMTNAAATTQYVIDTYDPEGIIFTGICGAINPRHQIGDIVIPDQWITHDYGYWGKDGLEVDSVSVGLRDGVGFQRMMDIMVDTALARKIGKAAEDISFRFRTVDRRLPDVHLGGAGVSGNAFIDSKSKRDQLFRELNAEIVDMESAAVVQTAHAAGVPVVVVRSCSDLAGGAGSGTAEKQLEEFFKVAAFNSSLVVKQFLENDY